MSRHWKEPSESHSEIVILKWNYYVYVCSFTFRFDSLTEIALYKAHFSHKVRPSSADDGDYEYTKWNSKLIGCAGDHWERQSRFDELPLYLFEEPKRQKVLKAFEKALADFSKNSL